MVENGSYLDPDEEDQEQVQAEDPPDLREAVLGKMFRLEVGLEDAGRVDPSEDGAHTAEAPEGDEPCAEAPFRVGLLVRGRRIAAGRGGPATTGLVPIVAVVVQPPLFGLLDIALLTGGRRLLGGFLGVVF